MKNAATSLIALVALIFLPVLSGCSKNEAPEERAQEQMQVGGPKFPEAFHPPGWQHSLEVDLGQCTEAGGDFIEIAILSATEYGLDCSQTYAKGEQSQVAFVDQTGRSRLVPLVDEGGAYKSKGSGGGFPIEFTVDRRMLLGKTLLTKDGKWMGEITAKSPTAIKNLPLSLAPENSGCSGGAPDFIGLDGYYYVRGSASEADKDGMTGGAGVGDVICRYKEGGEVEYLAGIYLPPHASWTYYCPDEASSQEACFYGIGHIVATPDGAVYVIDGSLGDQESDTGDSNTGTTRVRKIADGRVTTVLRVRNFELLAANRNNEIVVVRALQQPAEGRPKKYSVVKVTPDGKVLPEKPVPISSVRIDLAPSADGHVYVYSSTQTGPTKRRYDIVRID